MGKRESSPKVKALYEAIVLLFAEGRDLNSLTVSEITAQAGIGKGTAYEYFSNKEEMIAEALAFALKQNCDTIEQQMNEKETLSEKMRLLLNSMRENMGETSCFFKILHVVQDNSVLSNKIQEMFRDREEDEMPFIDLIRRMLQKEIGVRAEGKEAEFSYLYMSVFSKIICYAMYLFDGKSQELVGPDQMQDMICRDVCRSVEEF